MGLPEGRVGGRETQRRKEGREGNKELTLREMQTSLYRRDTETTPKQKRERERERERENMSSSATSARDREQGRRRG